MLSVYIKNVFEMDRLYMGGVALLYYRPRHVRNSLCTISEVFWKCKQFENRMVYICILRRDRLLGAVLPANYWLDQPAASFGWIVEAAAGQPRR